MHERGTFFVIVTTENVSSTSAFLDLGKAKRVKQQIRLVNVDFPEWMIESPSKEAARTGSWVRCEIKAWSAELIRLDERDLLSCRFLSAVCCSA
jgi:hypothetical protein